MVIQTARKNGRKFRTPVNKPFYGRTFRPFRARPASNFRQMAVRTGGWSNPVRAEHKFIDTIATIAIPFTNSTFAGVGLLNGCQQGSDASNRIGRKICMTSILFRWSASLGSTSTGGSPLRIVIVYDKQANGAAPVPLDIFQNNDFESNLNLNNRDRFLVLSDVYTQSMSANGEFATGGKIYKKLNLETVFNSGSAGTIGDITSGSIYAWVSQINTIGTANASFQVACRIRFTDP